MEDFLGLFPFSFQVLFNLILIVKKINIKIAVAKIQELGLE